MTRTAGRTAAAGRAEAAGRAPHEGRATVNAARKPGGRRIETAELLAIGTELLVGETRDTNSGDLARELTCLGVAVSRVTALPDELGTVAEAIGGALLRSDLVVCTGGLGPTPDDLTREAIGMATGETPAVDPALEAWLRALFERRGLPMARSNTKQAWLIPSARALPNPNGTAPGWWVDRPDGRLIVALPGPPGEMGPMWRDEVLPRLRERRPGADRAFLTLRLTGIGESALADLVGEEILRAPNPQVATYARPDAVDLRISALGGAGTDSREAPSAAQLVAQMADGLEPRLRPFLFARDDETWGDALGARLGGRTLSVLEIGTAGQLTALLAAAPWFRRGETIGPDDSSPGDHGDLGLAAQRVRQSAAADVGLAVRAREVAGDMAVELAAAFGDGEPVEASRSAFLAGEAGRRRAALAACAFLWELLGPV